jgi:hypothetical protein
MRGLRGLEVAAAPPRLGRWWEEAPYAALAPTVCFARSPQGPQPRVVVEERPVGPGVVVRFPIASNVGVKVVEPCTICRGRRVDLRLSGDARSPILHVNLNSQLPLESVCARPSD